MPLTIPSIDMIEIGAGGGSIAYVDDLGLLKVGPRERRLRARARPATAAAAPRRPSPTPTWCWACSTPTTSSAATCRSTSRRPKRAIDGLAAELRRQRARRPPPASTAIVAEAMAGAARAHATDRGVDHRGLPLLAFGGAGPVHACAVGELLQSAAVIFPPQASVLSAFGALVTPVRLDLVRSALGRLDALDWDEVDRLLRRDDRRGARGAGRGRRARPAGSACSSAPTCATSASRTRSASASTTIRARARDAERDPPGLRGRLLRPVRRQSLARADRGRQLAPDRAGPEDIAAAQRTAAAGARRAAAREGRRRSGRTAGAGQGLRPRQPRPRPGARRPGVDRGARDHHRAAAGLGRAWWTTSAASSPGGAT